TVVALFTLFTALVVPFVAGLPGGSLRAFAALVRGALHAGPPFAALAFTTLAFAVAGGFFGAGGFAFAALLGRYHGRRWRVGRAAVLILRIVLLVIILLVVVIIVVEVLVLLIVVIVLVTAFRSTGCRLGILHGQRFVLGGQRGDVLVVADELWTDGAAFGGLHLLLGDDLFDQVLFPERVGLLEVQLSGDL